ncbi:MAG: T9SS type A sorting domain-containing protein [Chitinophagales bacterium]|nr:T9SS type A sorting domain-containing protein [Chitinophagales bacterium]
MNRIKTRQKQFAHYSLLASSILAITSETDAQVIYTDVDPDTILSSYFDDQYDIDINDDAVPDFRIKLYSWGFTMYAGYDYLADLEALGDNKIAYKIDTSFIECSSWIQTEKVIPVLEPEDTIDAAMNFASGDVMFASASGDDFPCYGSGKSFGSWLEKNEKFAGVQFLIGSEIHYGWIRFSVDEWYNITLHDFAYESLAGVAIIAGRTSGTLASVAFPATSIISSDINNFGDGRDLQVAFDKAADETNIQEYRLFVVPASMADSFDIADALSSIYFSSVPVTGSDITTILFESTKDITGAYITHDMPYAIFVLSYSDTIPEVINTLSAPSNEIVLNEPVNIPGSIDTGIQIFSQSNYLHVQLPALNDKTSLSVTDNVGRKVFETQILQMENTFELSLSPGMYIATIKAGNEMYSKKISIFNE